MFWYIAGVVLGLIIAGYVAHRWGGWWNKTVEEVADKVNDVIDQNKK